MNLFLDVADNFKHIIAPSLVAIYAPHDSRSGLIFQTGTGYLVRHNDRPVVITALHTLYGENGTDDPAEKSFFWHGKLHRVGNPPRDVYKVADFDIAAFYADELAAKPQLDPRWLAMPRHPIPYISLGGYLARDFKRSGAGLNPAPRTHTDKRVASTKGLGFVSVRYTRRRNLDTFIGQRIQAAPRPKGLSGCPMIDSLSLLDGQPRIIGMFTDLVNGEAFGPSSHVTQAILASM